MLPRVVDVVVLTPRAYLTPYSCLVSPLLLSNACSRQTLVRALQTAASEVRQCAAEVGGVARRDRRVFTAEGADAHADPVRSAASAARMLRAALTRSHTQGGQANATATATQPLLQLLAELPQRMRAAEMLAGLGACCAGGGVSPSLVQELVQWIHSAIATLEPLAQV